MSNKLLNHYFLSLMTFSKRSIYIPSNFDLGTKMKLLNDKILQRDLTVAKISTVQLLVAGEFYEDDKPYLEQIEKLGIANLLILKTNFIPDSEVKYYFSAADVVVQPYRNATQSGVTPLSYHYEKPMIVTNVGGLPDLVPNEKVGLISEPDAASLAATIQRYMELGENYFLPHLRSEKLKYSWSVLTKTVFELTTASDLV